VSAFDFYSNKKDRYSSKTQQAKHQAHTPKYHLRPKFHTKKLERGLNFILILRAEERGAGEVLRAVTVWEKSRISKPSHQDSRHYKSKRMNVTCTLSLVASKKLQLCNKTCLTFNLTVIILFACMELRALHCSLLYVIVSLRHPCILRYRIVRAIVYPPVVRT
jgi:hypothetical protein